MTRVISEIDGRARLTSIQVHKIEGLHWWEKYAPSIFDKCDLSGAVSYA